MRVYKPSGNSNWLALRGGEDLIQWATLEVHQ